MDSLMKLGYSKTLTIDDLWELKHADSSAFVSQTFQNFWQDQLKKKTPSLMLTFMYIFGPSFAVDVIYKAIQDVLAFVQPQLLLQMMLFAEKYFENPQSIYNGIYISVGMLCVGVTQTFFLHQYFHSCFISGLRIRSCIITAVYKKALYLSAKSRNVSTIGEIINLMAVDASKICDLYTYIHILWSGPLQITMAIYFLYQTLGSSIFAGVAVMLLLTPLNAVYATKLKALNIIQMKNKDSRTKLMDELLNGMKIVKLYAWEEPFIEKVRAIRDREMKTLKKMAYVKSFQT
jgi:ABC-type multidrug transport system fused ATPase/permease subunit